MFKHLKIVFPFLFLFVVQSAIADKQRLIEHSIISPLAEKSLLLQSDRYSSLSVVVGERGHILYSNNNKDWVQADVETRQTLTNVFMLNEKTGWAVGHEAIILKTNDGAKSWQKVFSDINQETPLLDLFFKDELHGIAIGAYALMYETNDGGISWQKKGLNFSNNNVETRSPDFSDVFDFHLNDIAYAGKHRFYIASEAGHILRSDDNGKSWVDLPSPYQGSFFGVLPLSLNDVLAYGLRGHLYRSTDAGNSWERIEIKSKHMLTDAAVLANGNIVVVGLAGTMLLSKDNGETFSIINLNHRHSMSSVLETENGSVLLTGDAGVEFVPKEILIDEY